MPRSSLSWALAGLLPLGLATSGCASPVDEVRNQIDLPARWEIWVESSNDPSEVPSSFELRADGTATLKNVPGGTSRVVEALRSYSDEKFRYKCFDRSGLMYTGEATWKATDGGLLEISHEQETILWADSGYLSFDWLPLRLADCDEDDRPFYNGGSLFGENYRKS